MKNETKGGLIIASGFLVLYILGGLISGEWLVLTSAYAIASLCMAIFVYGVNKAVEDD